MGSLDRFDQDGGGRTTTTANQLNQELRALTDIMVNDLRRAGYWGAVVKGVANPFTAAATRPTISTPSANRDCVLYSYDALFNGGTAGNVDAGIDFFGFRLNDQGVVQAARSSTLADTTTGCSSVEWEDLTDGRAVRVTRLTFTTTGSKCIAFDVNAYLPDDPTTYTQWTTTGGTGPACDAAAPGAPSPYPAPTLVFVETRQINIAVQGSSLIDPTLPAMTLNETVLIRNNRIITP